MKKIILLGFFLLVSPFIAIAEDSSIKDTVPELITQMSLESGLTLADAKTLLTIATCESEMKQFDEKGNLIRGVVDSDDEGLFQINTYYHQKDADEKSIDLTTTSGNISYAILLYKWAGVDPWSASIDCQHRNGMLQ